ncbi:hypothetical protein IF1G_10021 [Cordyceps javanica]|uniref:Uncharacterized protein n=1 Tax=Cordyceps javanica TaxID=43265 RepID=A0A545UNV3_9HYPO|nr:hypothetical protein IF1G_10021 [Cordyceps javanica]TQW03072.1 hypothetical protein IF2G_09589 [Cordyceps javanica]
MVRPGKLVGVGLASLSSLVSATDAGTVSDTVLRLRDLGSLAGYSTTDLTRFSGTLRVARGIVEEHKRADIIEVPTSGLVSILDRIKALEKEVQDLLDGKSVDKSNKGIDSTASSSPSYHGSAGTSSSGGNSGSGSSSNGPSSISGSPSKDSTAGFASPKDPPSTYDSNAASSGESSDGGDDCAPEHLLYQLGGASLQRRSMTVSEHPLFRRNTKCNLDSVSGSNKGKALQGTSGVFKENSKFQATPSESDSESTITTTMTMTSTSYTTTTVYRNPGPVKYGAHGKYVNTTVPNSTLEQVTSAGTLVDNTPATSTETESISVSTALPDKIGMNQKYVLSETITEVSLLQKNATAPTSSESVAFMSAGGQLSPASALSSVNSSVATESLAPQTVTAAGSDAIPPVYQKYIPFETSASESMDATSTPESMDVISTATFEASSSDSTLSAASITATSLSIPEEKPKMLFSAMETASALGSQPVTPASTDEVSSASTASLDSLAITTSAMGAQFLELAEPTVTVTSTTTSTVSITVRRGSAARPTIDSAPDGPAAAEPLATESASVSDLAQSNGDLEKRHSGFRTVRTLRRKTAAVDEQ